MSLWKKLLPKKTEVEAATSGRRSRAPRVGSQSVEELAFLKADTATALKMVNLSATGIAFERSSVESWPERLGNFAGRLALGSDTFEIQLQVMRLAEHVVGCRFVNPPGQLSDALKERFKLEFSAAELVKIDPKMIKPEADGETHWFRGASASELFLATQGNSVLRFMLVFSGYRVEGGKNPVRFAKLRAGAVKRAYDESLYDEVPADKNLRRMAARFLGSVEGLSIAHREALLGLIG